MERRRQSWRILWYTRLISEADRASMLRIEGLNCGYGSVRAVHDVSFSIPAGSVFALLGPNGAGKTSTLMAIMGHVDIYAGRILFNEADITHGRAVARVNLGIAWVPEGRQLFSDLTVD